MCACPRNFLDRFIEEAAAWVGRSYPDIARNGDYTSLVSARHAARLRELLEEATRGGARVIPLEAPGIAAGAVMAPALVVGVDDGMRIMQEEIFGPLLPLIGYRMAEGALARINSHPRPLAFYYFGADRREERRVLAQ